MPYVRYRRTLHSSHEVYVATSGLYLNGVLHTWDAPLAALDDVSLVEEGGEARLVFSLRSRTGLGGGGYAPYTVEVPVPPGEEAVARRVEAHFRTRGIA
jgi:hypothetical protein